MMEFEDFLKYVRVKDKRTGELKSLILNECQRNMVKKFEKFGCSTDIRSRIKIRLGYDY